MVSLLKNLAKIYHIAPIFAKLIILALMRSKIDRIVKGTPSGISRAVVLGNGPSLSESLDALRKDVGRSVFFCVNHFADSSHFEALQPRYYFFLDPYFWDDAADASYREKRNNTFNILTEKTKWELTVFVPNYADMSKFEHLQSNSQITIMQYNSVGVRGLPTALYCSLLRSGFFSPYAINVVHHAIFIAIQLGYTAVDIYGIDSSVMKSLEVDQHDNSVYVTHKHYYGSSRVTPDNAGLAKRPLTIEECLRKEIDIFIGYRLLNDYASTRRVTLINRSAFSYVDTLVRGST